MFYLIADQNSWCIVSANKVIASECVEVNQSVSYRWNNETYVGEVIGKSEDYELLKKRLTILKKTPKVSSGQPVPSSSPTSDKRTRNPVRRLDLGMPSSKSSTIPKRSTRKQSDEEASRSRIKELNRNESLKRQSQKLMTELKANKKKKDDDSDWLVDAGNSDTGCESDDSDIKDIYAESKKKKKERQELLKGISKLPDRDLDEGTSAEKEMGRASQKPNFAPTSSPTKEDLLAKLAAAEAKLRLYDSKSSQEEPKFDNGDNGLSSDEHDSPDKSPSKNQHDSPDKSLSQNQAEKTEKTSEDEDGCDFQDEDKSLAYQLYTADDEDVVKLCRNVYCKKSYVNSAFSQSASVTHCIRRLMPGVFKPNVILNCSLTGQKWRAAPKAGEDGDKQPDPLHPRAVQAILDYANRLAKVKLWIPLKMKKAKPVFSQRLTEMKAAIKKGKTL